MPRTWLVGGLLLIGGLGFTSLLQAENWPGWRGPRGDGSSLEENLPRQWDGTSGKNIVWKTAIAGEGHGSPIVWEDHVFLVSCLPETQERVLICLDRKNGKIRWQQAVVKSPLESKHALNSHASCTPATDGKTVFAAFLEVDGRKVPAPNVGAPREITPGRIVVAAYDFSGHQKWIVRPGEFISAHGFCSNPVLFGDLVIVNGDHDGDSYIAALNKTTGETVWKTPREHKTRSYVTPLIREIEGQPQMVFSGSKRVVSLDPRNGSPRWTIEGPTEQFVASMVYDGQRFFMAAGFPTYHVMAIRPDGQGDVTETHVAWHSKEAKCYVPSPVVVGKYLLVADDRGTGNCFDTATGERLWQERMGKHFSPSLLTAGGLAYFLADDGVMKIVEPARELKVVETNALGESCYASPAISQRQILVRGDRHLYCIGSAESAEALAKKELAALAGTWIMAALEVEGEKVAEARLQGTELVIEKEGKYIVTAKSTRTEVVITLDPTRQPKEIDMVFSDGPNKDKVQRAIYELDVDSFKLCRSRDPESDRPKDFTSSPGTGQFVVTWKRQR